MLKKGLLGSAFILGLLFLVARNSGQQEPQRVNPDNTRAAESAALEVEESQTHAHKKVKSMTKPHKHETVVNDDSPVDFDFEREREQLAELNRQWPKSRQALMAVVTRPDPFQERKIKIEPHSVNEKLQNQIGALKVQALRTLMENQKDLNLVARDLKYIADNAKDPVIRRISDAAQDSLAKGRSFFDDFLGGVAKMPL